MPDFKQKCIKFNFCLGSHPIFVAIGAYGVNQMISAQIQSQENNNRFGDRAHQNVTILPGAIVLFLALI